MAMKKRYNLIAGLFLFVLMGIIATPSLAQIDRIDSFLRAGKEDAETITRAYLKPLPSGIGADLNSGWFGSAKPHKTLGFDIQVRGALSFIPSSDQTFDLDNLTLNKIRPADPGMTVSPTIGGNDAEGPEVIVEDNGDEVARFNLPSGSGFHMVPAPMIQASVGIVKQTDLIIRFIPKIDLDDYGDFSMHGFGLKHSINQWLPGGKVIPVDLSIMAGYNRINVSADLNLERDPEYLPDPTYTGNYDNQKLTTEFNTFNIRALVGKTIPFLSVYGGVGYETSSMSVDVEGDYPVPVSNPGPGPDFTETLTDPFSYSDEGTNGMSLIAGANVKLLFFNIYAEYTLAKYSVVNAGFGFSFR